jgi:hypothetical protein
MTKNHLRVGAACVLLFGATGVDFVSKVLSIASDLLLIGLAVWLLGPVLRKGLADEGQQ